MDTSPRWLVTILHMMDYAYLEKSADYDEMMMFKIAARKMYFEARAAGNNSRLIDARDAYIMARTYL